MHDSNDCFTSVFRELEATKSRLAQLQTLVTELEDNGGTVVGPRGLGVSPQLLRLVNELETEERETDGNDSENGSDMAALSMRVK